MKCWICKSHLSWGLDHQVPFPALDEKVEFSTVCALLLTKSLRDLDSSLSNKCIIIIIISLFKVGSYC